jgi:hypothetical protein
MVLFSLVLGVVLSPTRFLALAQGPDTRGLYVPPAATFIHDPAEIPIALEFRLTSLARVQSALDRARAFASPHGRVPHRCSPWRRFGFDHTEHPNWTGGYGGHISSIHGTSHGEDARPQGVARRHAREVQTGPAISQIRSLPAARGRIPATALTAHMRPEERVRSLVAGFQVHLGKPVDPLELAVVVASLARAGGSTTARSDQSLDFQLTSAA